MLPPDGRRRPSGLSLLTIGMSNSKFSLGLPRQGKLWLRGKGASKAPRPDAATKVSRTRRVTSTLGGAPTGLAFASPYARTWIALTCRTMCFSTVFGDPRRSKQSIIPESIPCFASLALSSVDFKRGGWSKVFKVARLRINAQGRASAPTSAGDRRRLPTLPRGRGRVRTCAARFSAALPRANS